MAESEEEVDVLVQRVIKDITNAFKKNPNIDEVGVIPCPEARYNRSPIVLVENKLGVESWSVKFLLPYVHNKLLLYRQRKLWLDREALVEITCTLLLLNPDLTTAWNVRKELLQCGVLDPEKDLYLGKLALTKFPKSPETWIHRRWVLQQILRHSLAVEGSRKNQQQGEAERAGTDWAQQLSDYLARTLHQEMKVCCDAACRYPSNYNAWSHRIWVMQHMAKGNIKVFHDELSSMRLWVSMHVSDHSGFHYRQFLLKELITELRQMPASCDNSCLVRESSRSSPNHSHSQNNRELGGQEGAREENQQPGLIAVLQLFHEEFELCSDLIQSFPGHETLWSHRRHVFYLWQQWRRDEQLFCSSNSSSGFYNHDDSNLLVDGALEDGVNGQRHSSEDIDLDGVSIPDRHGSKRLRRGVLAGPPAFTSEHVFVNSVLDNCLNPEQRRFAMAYKKWLDIIIGQEA